MTTATALFDVYQLAIMDQCWLFDLEPGDPVIVVGDSPLHLARRATVERVTPTSLIVVDGRHYDPVSGEAVTRRGYLERYTTDRWFELCAAVEDFLQTRGASC